MRRRRPRLVRTRPSHTGPPLGQKSTRRPALRYDRNTHPWPRSSAKRPTADGASSSSTLGVAEGTLDGFRDHHRAAAARRLDKIAPGLVREYLQKYHSAQVRKSMRGSLFPRGRISPMQPKQTQHTESAPRGPNRFQRRLTQLVRDETGDGRTIFDLLNGVMHGTLTGFKPNHRLESAKELAS